MGITEQLKIRKALVDEIEADLIGPRKGNTREEREKEKINNRPDQAYLAGVFFPGNWEVEEEEELRGDGGDTDDEDNSDSNVANDKLFKPSSFGFTCRLDPETKKIKATITYGQYYSTKNKEEINGKVPNFRIYHRESFIENFEIDVKEGTDTHSFKNKKEFEIRYTIIKKGNQLTLDFYVVNNVKDRESARLPDIMFQPKVTLESINDEYCFVEDTLDTTLINDPPEDEHLGILFNKEISFGKGHLCALTWDEKNIKDRKTNKIYTTFIPKQKIKYIGPTDIPENSNLKSSIDMIKLGSCKDKDELRNMLEPLVSGYETWISNTKNKVTDDKKLTDDERKIVLHKSEETKTALDRMKSGIDVLTSNDKAFDAFKFANMAIAWQQTMAKWAKENIEKGEVVGLDPLEPGDSRWKSPEWRIFQIAFILMNLESIVNPESKYHETVDLLWFPTGGGKTEAYLGLVAFVIAYRRLRGELGEESLGTAVIMRYTLRLLTVQQFQRAATLMCACEKIRISDKQKCPTCHGSKISDRNDRCETCDGAGVVRKWGDAPFQVGLWVGTNVTPNTRKAAVDKFWEVEKSKKKDLAEIKSQNPYILINCPWCGKKLKPTNGKVAGKPKQWRLFCGRSGANGCMFSEHLDADDDMSLPVVLVDEDVYSRCPSLIIATVDKFAQISWNPKVKGIFGKYDRYCDYCGFFDQTLRDSEHTHPSIKDKPPDYLSEVVLSPPEMIIQDELHLISGPLGTMAGLYETAVDYLCTSNNGVKPKIIASTATTRAAGDQIKKLFDRDDTKVFPPQVAEFGETFFSEIKRELSGKTYLGVLATGKSGLTVLARVSAVILRRIREFEESGKYKQEDLDPYFTLVNYFNSQRELGGASMNFKDSVPRFISIIQNSKNSSISPEAKGTKEEILLKDLETNDVDSDFEKEKELENEAIQDKVLRPHQFKYLYTDELTSRKNSGEIPEVLRRLGEGMKDSEHPLDLLLATNMIQVGVDIPRLGVMIVNGQPKNHSEYIQATGRIGRQNPGLIISLYAYTKPRDLSHYENFKIYHSTYYKNVETVSLTPFTLRARQLALFGVLVGMIRMKEARLSQDKDACQFDPKERDQQNLINEIKKIFEERVDSIDPDESSNTMKDFTHLINKWSNYVRRYNDLLKYAEPYYYKTSKAKKERFYYLLKKDAESKSQLIPTPNSLRNAEAEQRLFYLPPVEVKDD